MKVTVDSDGNGGSVMNIENPSVAKLIFLAGSKQKQLSDLGLNIITTDQICMDCGCIKTHCICQREKSETV